MIREFSEEITRLKAELESYGGGMSFGGVGGGSDGQHVIEVEKFIHVENKERM